MAEAQVSGVRKSDQDSIWTQDVGPGRPGCQCSICTPARCHAPLRLTPDWTLILICRWVAVEGGRLACRWSVEVIAPRQKSPVPCRHTFSMPAGVRSGGMNGRLEHGRGTSSSRCLPVRRSGNPVGEHHKQSIGRNSRRSRLQHRLIPTLCLSAVDRRRTGKSCADRSCSFAKIARTQVPSTNEQNRNRGAGRNYNSFGAYSHSLSLQAPLADPARRRAASTFLLVEPSDAKALRRNLQ
jgi:hypothetical protein